MCFGMMWSEQDSSLERFDRIRQVFLTEVHKAQVQKQIPFVEAEPCRCKILVNLICPATAHTVCETQVIMRECIVRMRAYNVPMQCYGCG